MSFATPGRVGNGNGASSLASPRRAPSSGNPRRSSTGSPLSNTANGGNGTLQRSSSMTRDRSPAPSTSPTNASSTGGNVYDDTPAGLRAVFDKGITRPTAATISKMSHAALPDADRQFLVEQKSRYEPPSFAPTILNKETKNPHLSVIERTTAASVQKVTVRKSPKMRVDDGKATFTTNLRATWDEDTLEREVQARVRAELTEREEEKRMEIMMEERQASVANEKRYFSERWRHADFDMKRQLVQEQRHRFKVMFAPIQEQRRIREDIERKIREKEDLEFAGPTQFMRFVEELYAAVEAEEGMLEQEEKLRIEHEIERLHRGEPSMMMASSQIHSPVSTHASSLAVSPAVSPLPANGGTNAGNFAPSSASSPSVSSSSPPVAGNARRISEGSRLEDDLRRVESQYRAEVDAAARRRHADMEAQQRLEQHRQSLIAERARYEEEKASSLSARRPTSSQSTASSIAPSPSAAFVNGNGSGPHSSNTSVNGQLNDTISSVASTPNRTLDEQRDELLRRLAELRMREERDRDEQLRAANGTPAIGSHSSSMNGHTPVPSSINPHGLHVNSHSTSSLRVSPVPSPSISPAAGPLGGTARAAHHQPAASADTTPHVTPPVSATNRSLNIVSAQATPVAASVPATVRASYTPVATTTALPTTTVPTSPPANQQPVAASTPSVTAPIPPVPAVVPAGISPVKSPSRIPQPSSLPKRASVSSPTNGTSSSSVAPATNGGSNSLAAAAAAAEEKSRRDMETKARQRAEAEAAERKRQADAQAAAEEEDRRRLLAAQAAAAAEAERIEQLRVAEEQKAKAEADAAAANPLNDAHVQAMMKGVTCVRVPRVGTGKSSLIKLSQLTDGTWVLDSLPNITGEKPFPLHSIRISKGMRDGQFAKRNLTALYGRSSSLCMSFVHTSSRSFDIVATNQSQFDIIYGVVSRLAT